MPVNSGVEDENKLFVLMARKPGTRQIEGKFYYHVYPTRQQAEDDMKYLRDRGYRSFDISELTIHI